MHLPAPMFCCYVDTASQFASVLYPDLSAWTAMLYWKGRSRKLNYIERGGAGSWMCLRMRLGFPSKLAPFLTHSSSVPWVHSSQSENYSFCGTAACTDSVVCLSECCAEHMWSVSYLRCGESVILNWFCWMYLLQRRILGCQPLHCVNWWLSDC